MRKSLVKIASAVVPGLITSFAYNQLTNPQVRKLRENELLTLNKADKDTLSFQGFDIQLYTWKGGEQELLLIHGWEGQAGNFSDLIEELIDRNFTVYAFDGPSHGFSSRGKTSLFEFTELVGLLIKKFNVRNLVSHSFGGVATTYALYQNPNITIDRYVLLTTPDKFTERIDDVCNMTGVSNKVKKCLVKRLEEETGQDVSLLNVSDFVQSIGTKDSLIIHDKKDKVIPIERSRNVHKNWPQSSFHEVEGTGHFRILRTQAVIDLVTTYLNKP